MKNKCFTEKCKNIIWLIFFLQMFWNIICILLFSDYIQYYVKKKFVVNNITASVIGILILLFLQPLVAKIPVKFKNFICLYIDKIILYISIIFFFIQIYLIYNYYFMTDWDVGLYIIPNVENIVNGSFELLSNDYFSRYNNNLLLLFIFSFVRRLDIAFGILDTSVGLMGLIIFQCIICMITGWLTYKITKKITHRICSALGAWIIYILLIGFSPWFSIPYSDATGLLFPILLIYVYVCEKQGEKQVIQNWFVMAIISVLGFKIKPQTIIIFIAILITEFFEIFSLNKQKYVLYLKKAIAILFGIIIALKISDICISTLNFQLDDEQAFSWEHYAMMGLNDKYNGGYNQEDINYSASFNTKKERQKANLYIAKNRLKEFGFVGLVKHLTKKTLTNFGDGTFAWGAEGSFFYETYEDKNQFMSPLLKSVYYLNGSNYYVWATIEQSCWIFVLIGIMGLLNDSKSKSRLFTFMLSLLGLMIFELIFEPRARYLFTYVPVFIILSISGWNQVIIISKRELNCWSRKVYRKI